MYKKPIAFACAMALSLACAHATLPDAVTGATSQTEENTSSSSFLIGTESLTANQITGTWGKATGVALFASQEDLDNAGGEQAASRMSETINNALQKMQVSDGTLEFTADGYFTVADQNGESAQGNWQLSGATLRIGAQGHSFDVNASLTDDGQLQLCFPVSNLLGKAQQYLPAVGAEGLYVGIRLSRQ
ncbi:MAG: DUF4923 family protein [Prevotellaceae bacterium]|nr:DUF4923 family protein [Prevotellaceae bacterium]